jgi:hypothetical protein
VVGAAGDTAHQTITYTCLSHIARYPPGSRPIRAMWFGCISVSVWIASKAYLQPLQRRHRGGRAEAPTMASDA